MEVYEDGGHVVTNKWENKLDNFKPDIDQLYNTFYNDCVLKALRTWKIKEEVHTM